MILDARRKRTAANAWVESIDPLNGLSIAQAKTIFNAARRHGSPLLQKIYSEIERSDPTLMTCVERRASALACLGWRAVADASAPDQDAAEGQRRALEEFADGIGNLDEAVEHLDLAFFRGYSVAQPIWEGGAVRHIELLDSWNFLLGDGGELLWNPGCSTDPRDCDEIGPEAMVVALRRRRAIDWPALAVFIRKYIGERDWGRFTERYGIPPVDAVMAPNATQEQRGQYLDAVEAARDGRGVVWPSGSTVSRAEGARGQDPFTAFVEHQEKQIVLMATGGTLTSLAQADTGSLAGGAQMDVWEQIVSRDGVAISGALNRGLFLPFLRQRFPGARPMARIVLGREAEPTAEESAELAGKIRAAGYTVDQSQLEEATGFKLEREEPQPQPGFGGMPAFNKAPAPRNPSSGVAKALQNARKGEGATDIPQNAETRSTALLRDFAADMAPAAKRIKSLLDMFDEVERGTGNGEQGTEEAMAAVRDEARKLAAELPDLMPDDPAMAAALEEAMAEAFAEGIGGEAVANAITNPCPKCHRQLRADGGCSHCEREELLSGGLKRISPNQAKSLLSEPVTVGNPTGTMFRFTKEKLLGEGSHLKADHTEADFERRARVMLYAIDAAKTSRDIKNGQASKPNGLGVFAQRKEVRKSYTDKESGKRFDVVVRADRDGEVFDVFDVFPR